MIIDLYTLELAERVEVEGRISFHICKYTENLSDCRNKYRIDVEVDSGITIMEYDNGTILDDGELIDIDLDSVYNCIISYCNSVLQDSPRVLTGIIVSKTLQLIYMRLTGKTTISANDLVLINNAVDRLYPACYLTVSDVYAKERLNNSGKNTEEYKGIIPILSYQVFSDLALQTSFTYCLDITTNNCVTRTSNGVIIYKPIERIGEDFLLVNSKESIQDFMFLCSLDIITQSEIHNGVFYLAKF